MNEKVLTAILRRDKAKALVRIEPLNSAFTHFMYSTYR
jgi:hypothetical protein